MKNRFDLLEKDLKHIEMEMVNPPEEELTKEEELINALLKQQVNLIELAPLSDEDVDQFWNTSDEEKLPTSLNVRVKKLFNKYARNEKTNEQFGFVPNSLAISFRKDDDTPHQEGEQVNEAIKRARERLKRKGDRP